MNRVSKYIIDNPLTFILGGPLSWIFNIPELLILSSKMSSKAEDIMCNLDLDLAVESNPFILPKNQSKNTTKPKKMGVREFKKSLVGLSEEERSQKIEEFSRSPIKLQVNKNLEKQKRNAIFIEAKKQLLNSDETKRFNNAIQTSGLKMLLCGFVLGIVLVIIFIIIFKDLI